MRNRNFQLLVLALLSVLGTAAQDTAFTSKPLKPGRYSMVAYFNGGVGAFFSGRGVPDHLPTDIHRFNPVGTVRVMWHPDHLLKAGLETGYIKFYSYDFTDENGKKGKVGLSAVPLLLVWSMSVSKHLNIFAGSGAYFLRTDLDYLGKSASKKFSVGWMAAASYIWPLGKNSGLGTEFKWLYAAETSNGNLCLQLQYVWRFKQW